MGTHALAVGGVMARGARWQNIQATLPSWAEADSSPRSATNACDAERIVVAVFVGRQVQGLVAPHAFEALVVVYLPLGFQLLV